MSYPWRNLEKNKQALNEAARSKALVVFDTETTGIGKDARIVEFAGSKCRFHDGKFTPYEDLHIYIKPPFPMPEKAMAVNGITDEFLADKPDEADAYKKIRAFLGEHPVLSAYNSKFDIRMLQGMYQRNGSEFIPGLDIDALKIARDLFCTIKTQDRKLRTIANAYGVDQGIEFHTAHDDVKVLIRVINAMITDMKREKTTGPKERLYINKMTYWPGFRGDSRVYLWTYRGGIYYAFKNDLWAAKDGWINLDQIDMQWIEDQAFAIAGCSDYQGLKQACKDGRFDKKTEAVK